MACMTVQVVTPDDIRCDHHADFISVKTPDGKMGILPEHINLIAPLTVHEVKIRRIDDDNRTDWVTINGGIIEVKDDLMTIVADSTGRERDIDVGHAERAKIHAERKLEQAQSIHDVDEVRCTQVALRHALNRISVGNK